MMFKATGVSCRFLNKKNSVPGSVPSYNLLIYWVITPNLPTAVYSPVVAESAPGSFLFPIVYVRLLPTRNFDLPAVGWIFYTACDMHAAALVQHAACPVP